MFRPSRTRRILTWTGVGLSFLFVTSWMASLWCGYAAQPAPDIYFSICRGRVLLSHSNFDMQRVFRPSTGFRTYPREDFGFTRPEFGLAPPAASGAAGATYIILPFWTLLLLPAIPTAWLWYRDRRLLSCSPDHLFCRGCGYDLTGNTSGVCPECGEKTRPPAGSADSEGGGQTMAAAEKSGR